MEQQNGQGADLAGGDAEVRRTAAAAMGRARTPAKVAATRQNAAIAAAARVGTKHSEETKAKLRQAQQARREREAAQRAGLAGPDQQGGLGLDQSAEGGNNGG